MRFVHYTDYPSLTLETLRNDYKQPAFEDKSVSHDKPRGLWLSEDDEEDNWKAWCEREDFHKCRLKYAYLATLDLNSVLHISSIKQIVKFYNAFSIRNDEDYGTINWRKVADNFKGIIISPYLPDVLWMYDYPFIWYASWDVACACIWDMSAIKNFEKIKGV